MKQLSHDAETFSDILVRTGADSIVVNTWLQGILYKKSSKPLSKEWKKKYVTLLKDGRLTYHPSLHVCCLSHACY